MAVTDIDLSYDADVPKKFFVIAVACIVLAPRLPLDEPFSVGGNLSNSFRKTLLFLSSCYLFRHFFLAGVSKSLTLVLWGMEGVVVSFLSLLMPYLLRVWMQDRVNVPGGRRPGKALMPWVKLFAVLTFVGIVLRIVTDNEAMWIFKKIADVLSFVPVMRTLRLYNSVTAPHGQVRYPGRGSVLSQAVMMAEYLVLSINVFDVLSKAAKLMGLLSADFFKTPVMTGLYYSISIATYTRILCHGILLNALDEAYEFRSSTATSGSTTNCSANSGTTSSTHSRASPSSAESIDMNTVAIALA